MKPTSANISPSQRTRLREAFAARKKADQAAVKSRGVEVLGFLRNNAKKDLEALEAKFLNDEMVAELIAKIEPEPESEETY